MLVGELARSASLDTPGVFDRYMDRMDDAIRYGVCWPTMDPVTLLGAIAGATERLGLAATVSTSSQKLPVLQVRHGITVSNLAALLGVKTFVIAAELISMKLFFSAHQDIDDETVRQICARRGFNIEFVPV